MKIDTLSVLERVAASRGSFSAEVSEEEFSIFAELESSGYIVGKIGPEAHDDPDMMIEEARLTAEGRSLLHRLRAEEKPRTNWAMISALIALAVFATAVIWKLIETP